MKQIRGGITEDDKPCPGVLRDPTVADRAFPDVCGQETVHRVKRRNKLKMKPAEGPVLAPALPADSRDADGDTGQSVPGISLCDSVLPHLKTWI